MTPEAGQFIKWEIGWQRLGESQAKRPVWAKVWVLSKHSAIGELWADRQEAQSTKKTDTEPLISSEKTIEDHAFKLV